MSGVIDLSQIDEATRARMAAMVQSSDDFELPHLSAWNYDPCENHSSVEEGSQVIPRCQKCGILPHRHQRVGAAWMYLEKKCLLADETGTGKTISLALTIALMAEAGELDDPRHRILLIIAPNATKQIYRQLKRMLPSLKIMLPPKLKSKRIAAVQNGDWQICIIGYQTFNNDLELYRNNQPFAVFIDDVEPISNSGNKTNYCINQICLKAERVCIMNATPLAKHLMQLYWTLEPLGGRQLLGPPTTFERRHIKYNFGKVSIKVGGETRAVMQRKLVGYRLIEELTETIQPKVLRRTAADIEDVEMPVLVPHEVYLDMYPLQQQKYEDIRKGAVKILKEDGNRVTLTKANNVFMIGQKICDGLATLGEADSPGSSIKKDLLEHALTDGVFSSEKVVVFMNFKDTIRAFHKRMDRRGIKYVTIWGEESDKDLRQRRQDQFWDDEDTQVLIGTSALVASLNLQIARHLWAHTLIQNPAKMRQLAGRIKRDGSSFHTVYLHMPLCNDSQEERYIAKLQREQAISDVVLGDTGDLFTGNLTPQETLRLITG